MLCAVSGPRGLALNFFPNDLRALEIQRSARGLRIRCVSVTYTVISAVFCRPKNTTPRERRSIKRVRFVVRKSWSTTYVRLNTPRMYVRWTTLRVEVGIAPRGCTVDRLPPVIRRSTSMGYHDKSGRLRDSLDRGQWSPARWRSRPSGLRKIEHQHLRLLPALDN
jgi:hypothetical protein